MASNRSKSLPAIGFLTVCEHAEHGLFGGFLVLNASARPLEFHCTAPVRPNRAQEILYGPTLKPYLYGEQIGQTLVSRAKANVLLVCTDLEPALALREHTDFPVALVETPSANQVGGEERTFRVDEPHAARGPNHLVRFQLARHPLAVLSDYPDDQQEILQRWSPYADDFDLQEPFTRIREAIEEAQRSAR